MLHGHDNSNEDHAFQAMHLASWGMHGLALDLPNRGPWIANGRTLARLVDAIHRTPQLVDDRIDANKMILAVHSFGATAVAAALGEGAPALGGVLLDPAGIGRQLRQLLRRITVQSRLRATGPALPPRVIRRNQNHLTSGFRMANAPERKTYVPQT